MPDISQVISTLGALLLAANVFFLRRVFVQIDGNTQTQAAQGTQLAAISGNVETFGRALTDMKKNFGEKIAELKDDVKVLKKMEVDVAVLRERVGAKEKC